MKGLDHPSVPRMFGYNVINIQTICSVIDSDKSDPADKVTLN